MVFWSKPQLRTKSRIQVRVKFGIERKDRFIIIIFICLFIFIFTIGYRLSLNLLSAWSCLEDASGSCKP